MIAIGVGLIFVLMTIYFSLWTTSIINDQYDAVTEKFTHIVGDMAQACGESSNIETLKLFLRNIENHDIVENLHVIRSHVTEKDFDPREGSKPADAVESQTLEDGMPRRIVDRKSHEVRYVMATKAEETCVRRCHESAHVGDVLGVSSVTICTEESDAARAKMARIMCFAFSLTGIVLVMTILILISRKNSEKTRKQAEVTNRALMSHVRKIEELAEKAKAANEAKSQFLANMSHEIRTPMNAVIGFNSLLLEEGLNAEQQEYVNLSLDSAQNLLVLINDILDFSKIEAGKLNLEVRDVSTAELLKSINGMFFQMTEKKGLEFQVIAGENLPETIRTDSQRLTQCLINLINNAIKFTSEGHVYVRATALSNDKNLFLRFDVEDTGIGVPEEKKELIFEAFTQADSTHSREFGGTGLGLNITQKLVRLLNGELEITNGAGSGSVFSVTIPVDIDNTSQVLLSSNGDSSLTPLKKSIDSLIWKANELGSLCSDEASVLSQDDEVAGDIHLNCWEYKKCGREPGGLNTETLGVCPASIKSEYDSHNHGKNAGRCCWMVAGTMGSGDVSCVCASKLMSCYDCGFFHLVQQQETLSVEDDQTTTR